MKSVNFLAAFVVLALASSIASAYDSSLLQDICVAINNLNNGVFVNGKFCKNSMQVSANDFYFSGLNVPGNTGNNVGSNVTLVDINNIPGLNTLGISIARLDFAANGGLNPPHTHPRGTEILVVLKGTLLVGFVTSNQDGNRLFTKTLKAGDVFVFPIGLIHFQLNIAKTPAVAFAGLSSPNPGAITVANAVFNATPSINLDVLSKAFVLNENMVKDLQHKFGGN